MNGKIYRPSPNPFLHGSWLLLIMNCTLGSGVCPNASVCDVNAVCAYSNNQAFCSCKAGFSGDGSTCAGAYLVQVYFNYFEN